MRIQIIALALFASVSLTAQEVSPLGYWKNITEKEITFTGQRQIIPQKYLTVSADIKVIKTLLAQAPNEKNRPLQLSPCIISLPAPDGSLQRFRVVNSPVMAEELAAAYPNIQTFSIKGIDDPYASGKLDLTEFGFHAMVFSPLGDYFIDPYSTADIQHYISYFTADFIKNPAHTLPEAGLITEENTIEQKKPQPAQGSQGANKPAAPPAPCVGSQLKTYRLAVACTGEYAVAATGQSNPSVAQTLAKIVTTVNRVDGVYEKEVAVRLVLVATQTQVVFTSASSDPFTGNNNANTLISQSQSVITATIGSANFDIGHTFSTGGGGLAFLGCVCNTNTKARGITGSPNPVGDPYDIDYVAHEMGHQFGGEHTFNAITGSCNGNRASNSAAEPGSGITIMGYAGICGSVDNLGGNSIAYFHAVSYDQIVNFTNGLGLACSVTSSSGNQPPAVTVPSGYIVPVSTPFYLSGSATDPDSDPLVYSWEETDIGASAASWNAGVKPYFMSYAPTTNSTRFFPKATVVASGNYTNTRGEFLPKTPQNLNFRLTARDNKMGGGGVCYSNITVTVDPSGPLMVTHPSSLGISWASLSQQNITWDVNGTNFAPVSCDSVRILISYNSGNTYSVLINSTANDGIESVITPSVASDIITCRIKIESIGNVFYDIGNYNFAITTDSNVGVPELSANNPVGLSAWPNPAGDKLNIAVARLEQNSETDIVISDLVGKQVYKTSWQNRAWLKEELDISSLAPGVYHLRVSNHNRESIYRLVKE